MRWVFVLMELCSYVLQDAILNAMESCGMEQEHEGDKYLRLLGLSHLADKEINAGDRTIEARDFLEVCGEHARPMLVGFETLSTDDPRYEPTREALRGFISQFVEKPAEAN
jgi:hypothetical protein